MQIIELQESIMTMITNATLELLVMAIATTLRLVTMSHHIGCNNSCSGNNVSMTMNNKRINGLKFFLNFIIFLYNFSLLAFVLRDDKQTKQS